MFTSLRDTPKTVTDIPDRIAAGEMDATESFWTLLIVNITFMSNDFAGRLFYS